MIVYNTILCEGVILVSGNCKKDLFSLSVFSTYINEKGNLAMDKVKRTISYWCNDTRNKLYVGKDIGVAILDTGISYHPDFDDRILAVEDMRGDNKFGYDINGHGTHVAGIIGGSGRLSGGAYSGIAPSSNLIVVRVLDEKGDGEIETVIKGIRWIRRNRKKYNIRVINISVGTLPHVGNREEEALLKEVEMLWDDGMIVVAAAGNYGPAWGTITTPGVSKKIITVGTSNDDETLEGPGRLRKNYSGRGPTRECVVKPDILAPGSKVMSCNGRYERTGRAYTLKSGTSMSAPVVSGAIAALLSKYPTMSNVEVKLRLGQTCRNLGLDKNRQGWGLLNVKDLLEL